MHVLAPATGPKLLIWSFSMPDLSVFVVRIKIINVL